MKRSVFLLITAILSFGFGALMFFGSGIAAKLFGITANADTLAVLRGMGGLIFGMGLINFLLRNNRDRETLRALLMTNMITSAVGLAADLWGIYDGALTISKMEPIEVTHLFVGIGSLICWTKLFSRTPLA